MFDWIKKTYKMPGKSFGPRYKTGLILYNTGLISDVSIMIVAVDSLI